MPGNETEVFFLEKPKKYPSIQNAILLVIVFLVIQIVAMIVGSIIGVGADSFENPLAAGILNAASIGILISIGLEKNKVSFRQQFSFQPFRLSLLLPMLSTFAGLSILISETDNLINTVLPMPSSLSTMFANFYNGFWGLVLLVLIAPVTEELLFRGFILDSFLTNYGVKTSVVASSVLFGIFHFNPWQFIGAAIIGIVLAWLYIETRSVLACMAGHALYNAIPVLASLIKLNIPGYTVVVPGQVIFQPLWFDAVGLVLFGLGLFVLSKIFLQKQNPG